MIVTSGCEMSLQRADGYDFRSGTAIDLELAADTDRDGSSSSKSSFIPDKSNELGYLLHPSRSSYYHIHYLFMDMPTHDWGMCLGMYKQDNQSKEVLQRHVSRDVQTRQSEPGSTAETCV
ncbi:hypothetical protein Bpfe_026400 [Biomphalaria pfeifferi]|uniref:Uncharacterized protein n=1 Tax=Biomphalaria pfeifferi TaxID=112525 RepID=A0AAD8AXC9_BIOPF|nr:hypothetical protein Bpfe_026400 [Biomphalaria pfeifferi]